MREREQVLSRPVVITSLSTYCIVLLPRRREADEDGTPSSRISFSRRAT